MPGSAPSRSSTFARALLVCAVLPALFVVFDCLLFMRTIFAQTSDRAMAIIVASFLVRLAFFGALGSSLVKSPVLRTALLLWCCLQLDIQLLFGVRTPGRYGEAIFVSIFQAQMALVATWAVFATRWPALRMLVYMGVAIFCASNLSDWRGRNQLGYVCIVQVLTFLALCLVLRWRGYLIGHISAPTISVPARTERVRQFGLRHAFAWVTLASMFLAAAVALGPDLVRISVIALRRSGFDEVWYACFLGSLSSLVLLTAVHGALGRTRASLRWPLTFGGVLVFSVASAVAAHVPLVELPTLFSQFALVWRRAVYHLGPTVVAQALTAGIVFGTLLLVRCQGYRLQQRRLPLAPEPVPDAWEHSLSENSPSAIGET